MRTIFRRGQHSRPQWSALIARAEHNELSMTELCRRESVSAASFYTWRNRLRALGELPSAPAAVGADFIDLGTLGETKDNTDPWLIELDLGAGMVLRLRRA